MTTKFRPNVAALRALFSSFVTQRQPIWLAILILLAGLQGARADGPTTGFNDWISKGVELSSSGNYPAAAHAFRQALALAEANNLEECQTIIEVHEALGMAYSEIGRFSDSVREFRRALAITEKTKGRNTILCGRLLAKIAANSGEGRNDEKSVARLQEIIAANRQTASAEQLALLRLSLANMFMREQEYEATETTLLEALAALRRQQASSSTWMVNILNALGVLRFTQRRYGDAVTLYRESLDVMDIEGAEPRQTAIPVLNNLASSYVKLGRLHEAANTYQRAIPVASKMLGEDHPYYGLVLGNYAVVLRELGRKREAKKLDERSRDILRAFRRRSGDDSTIAITALR